MKRLMVLAMAVAPAMIGGTVSAQTSPPAPAAPAAPAAASRRPPVVVLGDGPWDFTTEKARIRLSVVTKGLDHPWSLAFIPDGSILITERPGRLRVLRKGVLDPTPIAGLPDILGEGLGGLMDITLHPQFAKNHLIYMTYTKPGAEVRAQSTLAVMRARWDGGSTLTDVQDIFVVPDWYGALPLPKRCCGQGPASGSYGSRILFDRAGFLYVTSGDRNYGEKAQDPSTDIGKILRLRDDGTVPRDNPFVRKAGYRPEIYTIGHRNPLGLTIHPVTRELWSSEFGPRGGDEVNRIKAGKNYGWMDVTQGAHYNNEPVKAVKGVAGMEDPVLTWAPSINPGNLTFYTGDRFPGWKGNMLMATMSRPVVRVTFDAKGRPIGEERMLADLKQRFRDVRVGPDGMIYLLTDETAGALLKLEPAN
jgi:glucose/arabinose dehydrogenase